MSCAQTLKLQGPVPEKCTPAVIAGGREASAGRALDVGRLPAAGPAGRGCLPSAAEDTILNPTNSRHYWGFRVHVNLEAKFLGDIQALLLGALFLQGRSLLNVQLVQPLCKRL